MIEEILLKEQKIQAILKAKNIDAIILSDNINLFYFLGQIIIGYIYIPSEGESIVFSRSNAIIAGKEIFNIRKPEDIYPMLGKMGIKPQILCLNDEYISASDFLRLSKAFDGVSIATNQNVMRRVRMVKTPYEIELITASAKAHVELYKKVPSVFKRGMTDIEFSIEVEREARLLGHLGIFHTYGSTMEAFMGTILSGDNALAPSPYDFALGGAGSHPSLPVGAIGKMIEEGTTVMVDISSNVSGYLSDMTRTYMIGNADKKIIDIHNVSILIQDELMAMAKVGMPVSELWVKTEEIVNKHNLASCFMGLTKQAKFVGHGLGLEINEMPVLTPRDNTPLEVGMAMAIEPKFVVEGIGAVGCEDTFVMRGDGLVRITDGDRELVEI